MFSFADLIAADVQLFNVFCSVAFFCLLPQLWSASSLVEAVTAALWLLIPLPPAHLSYCSQNCFTKRKTWSLPALEPKGLSIISRRWVKQFTWRSSLSTACPNPPCGLTPHTIQTEMERELNLKLSMGSNPESYVLSNFRQINYLLWASVSLVLRRKVKWESKKGKHSALRISTLGRGKAKRKHN